MTRRTTMVSDEQINTNDSDEAGYSQVNDVIDRPTCKFKPANGQDLMGEVSLVECTACAWTIEPWIAYEFRYCPMCGAEVVLVDD